ncbi:MAG: flagellar basal body-associated FliL family protein [Alphaproteobacteria bacterium]|nr:flagellar basal body-associated FliL family protein [Alphaproteobacteria bacterium]
MVVVEETDESAEVLVEKAATQVLAYLRTTGLRQIEGPSGLLYLRQDLNDVIAALSGGQIREVLIHSLVVE